MYGVDVPLRLRQEKLLWADVRDLRRPAGVSIRGVRFLTCVELQSGIAFILEGLRLEPGNAVPERRQFLTGAFVHTLSECRAWALQEPQLFVYIAAGVHGAHPVLARVMEVHGNTPDGPLVLKFENGESMIADVDSGPLPTGPLKRLFPLP